MKKSIGKLELELKAIKEEVKAEVEKVNALKVTNMNEKQNDHSFLNRNGFSNGNQNNGWRGQRKPPKSWTKFLAG